MTIDRTVIEKRLRTQARQNKIRITVHAHKEMAADDVSYNALRGALENCRVLENYPEHRRGPCCLVLGGEEAKRPLHIVCTTSVEVAIIITVYEPTPPKWVTPDRRGGSK